MKIEIGQENNFENCVSKIRSSLESFYKIKISEHGQDFKCVTRVNKLFLLINKFSIFDELSSDDKIDIIGDKIEAVFIDFPLLKAITHDCISKNLKFLYLQNCDELEKLPNQLPESLVYLNLAGCNKLEQLPDNLLKIKYLNLDGCDSLKLDNIEKLISLKLANLGEQNFALILPNHLQKQFQKKLKEKTKNDGNIPASSVYLHQSREPERSSISDSIDSVNVASIILSQSRFPSRESNSSSASSLLPDSKRRKIDNR